MTKFKHGIGIALGVIAGVGIGLGLVALAAKVVKWAWM